VERREAQRLSHQARTALARLCGGLDRKSSPKVPRKHLGASRRSIAPLTREVEFAKLGCIDCTARPMAAEHAERKFTPVIPADRKPPRSCDFLQAFKPSEFVASEIDHSSSTDRFSPRWD